MFCGVRQHSAHPKCLLLACHAAGQCRACRARDAGGVLTRAGPGRGVAQPAPRLWGERRKRVLSIRCRSIMLVAMGSSAALAPLHPFLPSARWAPCPPAIKWTTARPSACRLPLTGATAALCLTLTVGLPASWRAWRANLGNSNCWAGVPKLAPCPHRSSACCRHGPAGVWQHQRAAGGDPLCHHLQPALHGDTRHSAQPRLHGPHHSLHTARHAPAALHAVVAVSW